LRSKYVILLTRVLLKNDDSIVTEYCQIKGRWTREGKRDGEEVK